MVSKPVWPKALRRRDQRTDDRLLGVASPEVRSSRQSVTPRGTGNRNSRRDAVGERMQRPPDDVIRIRERHCLFPLVTARGFYSTKLEDCVCDI